MWNTLFMTGEIALILFLLGMTFKTPDNQQ